MRLRRRSATTRSSRSHAGCIRLASGRDSGIEVTAPRLDRGRLDHVDRCDIHLGPPCLISKCGRRKVLPIASQQPERDCRCRIGHRQLCPKPPEAPVRLRRGSARASLQSRVNASASKNRPTASADGFFCRSLARDSPGGVLPTVGFRSSAEAHHRRRFTKRPAAPGRPARTVGPGAATNAAQARPSGATTHLADGARRREDPGATRRSVRGAR
jgi:hypothetical protein